MELFWAVVPTFTHVVVVCMCSQLLEQLRGNRASLKPPQLQMLEQLEAQLAMMHQVQINTHKHNHTFM